MKYPRVDVEMLHWASLTLVVYTVIVAGSTALSQRLRQKSNVQKAIEELVIFCAIALGKEFY